MYVNQIDSIIDKILDNLYLEGLKKDNTFNSIVNGKKINYVEYREKINLFIQQFMDQVDKSEIQKLINNKENLARIMDIIKRYVAYYYFLSIAYYYAGGIKDFRNNLIQYSKLQENSSFTVKNFFDTENNYQLINFYKIIKDVSKIITMTEMQKKTLNPLDVKDAITFLNNLGSEYVNNYFLMIVKKDGSEQVEINVHNLIKTIVFNNIYRNQEQNMVFEILNDLEESKHEYTFIDIVVSGDDVADFESYRQIFLGEDNSEVIAKDLYDLSNELAKPSTLPSSETKNVHLLEFNMITPIVDNFLRYHRDTEKLETEGDKAFTMPLVSNNNAKNIQMALLYQQRKKKENTRAQLIVNKIDAISDYYSENVQNNADVLRDIKKYFQNPLAYRKAVMHNYLEELKVVDKIQNQGRKAIEENEYYLELNHIISNAHFNFKDFQQYGVSIMLNQQTPINMLRYSNIEFRTQMPHLEIDTETGIAENMINLVGLALGPLDGSPIQCVRKENLVDIRNVKLNYYKDGKIVTKGSSNGYKAFLKFFKYFYIDTIRIKTEPSIQLYNDMDEIRKINSDLFNKIIYWVYDINKDTYEMDTYENIKSYNFQETFRFMNASIYDKIIEFLNKKLTRLIQEHHDFSIFKIETLVELYSTIYRLFLNQNEKREIIIRDYLNQITLKPPQITSYSESEKNQMPEYISIPDLSTFRIKINMTNPLHPKEYIKLEAYSGEKKEPSTVSKTENKCKHELEWAELSKLKSHNLNKYNSAATEFIEKYSIETTDLDYVCNICGQILPIKQYVQDGSFDNNTQKFITAYVPLDIPLEEIREYAKYKLTIRYMDALINRVSLITGTNMLVGPSTHIKQKRKGLVKNIIDLIVKHNMINLKKKQNDEERLEFYSRKFNIDKDFDSVYFFELDDEVLDFNPSASSTNTDLNRLKYNNILLYFLLVFVTELTGSQIAMMFSDKIANIYVFNKFGPKLFSNLLLKKNISDVETVPITDYPVLCYLIFLISYCLVKFKLWYYPGGDSKTFNPYYQKVIINSLVDLFNSISIDAGKMPNEYVYMLTTSKLYTQMNTTFKNNEIINMLERNHIKYADKSKDKIVVTVEEKIKTYSISNPIPYVLKTRKIPTFKISKGISFDRLDRIIYPEVIGITDLTNCPTGSYHKWVSKGKDVICALCGENIDQVSSTIDRFQEVYYYELSTIANRRCLQGTIHDFVGKDGKFVCTICKRQPGEKYTREELDTLAKNLNKLENERIAEILTNISKQAKLQMEEYENMEKHYNDLIVNFQKNTGEKVNGSIVKQIDKLIQVLESLIGVDTNLDIDKFPVYLRDNVYVVDHNFSGALLNEPIVITQKENRIHFKEEHTFFKTDVYYYTDNRTQTDVFYHAVTLKLLGYKEKHKEYVKINKANAYLKISPSIKNRLLMIGHETQYIDIGDMFSKNSKTITDTNLNYFSIVDSLIRDHIYKTRSIVDKISSTLYKIKNYQPQQDTETPPIYLQTSQAIEKLVSKYAKTIKNLKLGTKDDAFSDWNLIRSLFSYKPINWEETNVRANNNMYVNADLINYYDIASNIMMYYVINEFLSIIDSNSEKMNKINIAQMYVEIIVHLHSIYNIDPYKNSMEFKRFEQILNGSEILVDILRKGQGLMQSKEIEEELDDTRPDLIEETELTEEQQEELEDLKEEAEALDVEGDYYAEEDEDYAQEGDYEG